MSGEVSQSRTPSPDVATDKSKQNRSTSLDMWLTRVEGQLSPSASLA